jgi:hypothetical protein
VEVDDGHAGVLGLPMDFVCIARGSSDKYVTGWSESFNDFVQWLAFGVDWPNCVALSDLRDGRLV